MLFRFFVQFYVPLLPPCNENNSYMFFSLFLITTGSDIEINNFDFGVTTYDMAVIVMNAISSFIIHIHYLICENALIKVQGNHKYIIY